MTDQPRLAGELRSRGLRVTPQRELILSAVNALGHATPDEVLAHVRDQAPGLNVTTVYRTLSVLQELGLIQHTHLSDKAPTYHAMTEHEHFHLVCRKCQAVRSVTADMALDFAAQVREQHGFVADIGHLTMFGDCVDCSAAPHHHEGHATS